MVPFMMMCFVLPAIIVTISSNMDAWWLTQLPFFLGEAALGILGAPVSASAGMIVMSHLDLSNVAYMAALGLIWTVAFLVIGLIKTERREM